MAIWPHKLHLTRPGLFVTGTDTGVGKTVVTCAIAYCLRVAGVRVGVSKPMSSDCRHDREGLVNGDAEALAHFSDCRLPLATINPVRYQPPLAPGVAAAETGKAVDFAAIAEGLERVDAASECTLVEGVGGLMVPIDGARPDVTVLDLIAELPYPTLVVTRPGLGTLSHTAMTVQLLKARGCKVLGIVVNGYDADPSSSTDVSLRTNRQWIEKMTGRPILATVPRSTPAHGVRPEKGELPQEILDAVSVVDWPDVIGC